MVQLNHTYRDSKAIRNNGFSLYVPSCEDPKATKKH